MPLGNKILIFEYLINNNMDSIYIALFHISQSALTLIITLERPRITATFDSVSAS